MSTSVEGPDPTQAAELQAKSSKEVTQAQTVANRPDIYTPWGSMTWSQDVRKDPTTGQDMTYWTGRTQLNDSQQRALDAQQAAQLGRSQMAEDLLGQTRNQMLTPLPDRSGQAGADAMYGQMTSRLDPMWQERETDFNQQMANQGISQGGEAYDRLYGDFSRGRNDAYEQAALQSTMYGNQYAQQQQALDLAARTGSLNLMNAAISGEQVAMPQMPGFNQAGAAQATQYLQANQQAQNQAAMQNQFMSDMIGGAVQGAGSAMMMFSDERLKENVERYNVDVIPGVRLASWNWKGDPKRHYGVIAQDVEKVRPDLVNEFAGYKMVNYGGLR